MKRFPQISSRSARGPAVAGRAFSLVEVLLAVLVLGLGLLGLAAVFPVVISQQRESFDTVAAGPARVAVRSYVEASQLRPTWQDILYDPDFGRDGGNPDNPDIPMVDEDTAEAWVQEADLDWYPGWSWNGMSIDPERELERTGTLYIAAGSRLTFDDANNQWNTPDAAASNLFDERLVAIPVQSRLFPAPYTGSRPQFVWDVVPRRTARNEMQLALFVRRIDTGIQVPQGFTLSDVLTNATGELQASSVRLPVGIDDEGRPTGNGAPVNRPAEGLYALPIRVDATLLNDPSVADEDETFDRVRLTWAGAPSVDRRANGLRRAAAAGQYLVDNTGVVRQVVERLLLNDATAEVRVEPAFTATQEYAGGNAVSDLEPGGRETVLRSVVFTPQVPAVAPVVLTIREGSS